MGIAPYVIFLILAIVMLFLSVKKLDSLSPEEEQALKALNCNVIQDEDGSFVASVSINGQLIYAVGSSKKEAKMNLLYELKSICREINEDEFHSCWLTVKQQILNSGIHA